VLCFSNNTSTHAKGEKWQKSWRKKLFEQKQARVLREKKKTYCDFCRFLRKEQKKGQREGN